MTVLQTARSLGVQVMSGTDTGNSPVMPYGVLHAHEAEVMVKFGGYTPLEAITASTKDNAYSVGMEGELGVIEAGKLADLLILDADPLDDIRVLQGGKHLNSVIKDGRRVDLSAEPEDETVLALP